MYEGIEYDYLEDRIGQIAYLGDKMVEAGVPIQQPTGGHGIFIDAKRLFTHLPQSEFPAQALTVELYIEGGVRGVELGTCAFGHTDPETGSVIYPELECVRLAIPRRVYTDRHMDMVVETMKNIVARKDTVRGLKLVYEAPVMRHFTARFERL